jgi:arylsulfatase
MKRFLLFLSVSLLACALCAPPPLAAAPPNILVVLADDLGFSDLGCYGGEIATPTLDRLAAKGVRFTQFYNTAKCHSSRVSLLSGRWCRQAGDESLQRAVTLPEVLAPAGYFTAMSGKWHLQKQPTDFGFQRFFGHLSGACNYYKGDQSFRLNGQPWPVPSEGFYTTVANVDHALGFLNEARQAEQPWFLYLAFNAPHAPLQPLEADYKKYLGRYDVGWDAVRAARASKQKALGLFSQDVAMAPRPDHLPAWDSLTPDMKKWEARRMAAYAALIDRVDQELGRLLADVEAKGELDNTLVLFFSDNGACPYDRRSIGMDREPYEPETRWSDSTGWAWARNTPFRYYKQNQYEGGITTPAIAHWPAGIKTAPGTLIHSSAHLVDVLPTLAEIAGASVPTQWPDRELTPLAGVSLKPLLDGQAMTRRPPIHLLFTSDRGLRDGNWKLVSFQSEPWELYDLGQDRAETRDLAAEHPERVQAMAATWHQMAEHVLKAPAKERQPVAVAAQPTGKPHREWTDFTAADPAAKSQRPSGGKANKKKSQPTDAKAKAQGPRARVGTKLTIEAEEGVLHCTGTDPGLAFDLVPQAADSSGPYQLVFSFKSEASGKGELYFTTDAKTLLPGGQHQEFEVQHDGQWHDQTLHLETTKTLHGFRLDPCGGPGVVRLRDLKLLDTTGKILHHWP